ncbi:hypothetical protein CAPTEDRAFT_207292 [Capitella teleta]|uniref:Uncharacterized protein n=1 Tax=Capitella teleta TaxID=283909 RepID=R7U4X3_CAPTE|nr:hypothetical protein CAPTEDRAFT_207292 [Capitella teleta]|eukprot:ELT98741.1 hypothetical protein CAPTEDRAFT_207292 [Capitella teleta]
MSKEWNLQEPCEARGEELVCWEELKEGCCDSTEIIDSSWTNNNCESINHVLKMAINWQPKRLVELIDALYDLVRGQYNEVERSLIGRGDYELCPEFDRFLVKEEAWVSNTREKRERHLKRFLSSQKLVNQKAVPSSDGHRLYQDVGGSFAVQSSDDSSNRMLEDPLPSYDQMIPPTGCWRILCRPIIRSLLQQDVGGCFAVL